MTAIQTLCYDSANWESAPVSDLAGSLSALHQSLASIVHHLSERKVEQDADDEGYVSRVSSRVKKVLLIVDSSSVTGDNGAAHRR